MKEAWSRKPKEPNAMVWYFNMQGREVVSINARLEDLATIDAFCKKRNISRSSLMVQAATQNTYMPTPETSRTNGAKGGRPKGRLSATEYEVRKAVRKSLRERCTLAKRR